MNKLLGLNVSAHELNLQQICLRAIIVFVITLVMVRIADKRFLAKLAAFDVILGFLLASMMARAVNGTAAFWPTMVGGFVLVFLHRLIGTLSYHMDWFGKLVKGDARLVIERGKANSGTLRSLHISEKDLVEEVRLNGNLESIDQVKEAFLERNGKISVVPFKS